METKRIETMIEDALHRAQFLEREAHAERLKIEEVLRELRAATPSTSTLAKGSQPIPTTSETMPRLLAAIRQVLPPGTYLTTAEIAAKVREPVQRLVEVMRDLQQLPCPTAAPDAGACCVYNHSTPEAPLWGWVVGDEADPSTISAEVETLIRRRPYSFKELRAAIGARRGRISGAVVAIARVARNPLWNVSGNGRVYRWFLGDTSRLSAVDRARAQRIKLADG